MPSEVDGTIVAVGLDDAGGDRNAAVVDVVERQHVGRAYRTLPWARRASSGWMPSRRSTGTSSRSARSGSAATSTLRVWRSEDRGTSWVRVEGAASGLHEASDQAMRVIATAAPGFVAAGSDTSPDGDLDAAVWTSKDGIQLEPADAGVPLG